MGIWVSSPSILISSGTESYHSKMSRSSDSKSLRFMWRIRTWSKQSTSFQTLAPSLEKVIMDLRYGNSSYKCNQHSVR